MVDWLRKNSLKSAVGPLSWNDKGDVNDFKFVFYTFEADGKRIEAQ
jgi:branched-chain amino acid transport system substrate-binding protein